MLNENMNIQFYPPGGGYKIFHCELDRINIHITKDF